MAETWFNAVGALLKRVFDSFIAAPDSTGAIQDLDEGNGASFGTLSSLAADITNPHRLFAVTDQDSPPLRIIEIDVAASPPRAVGQIEISAPGLDHLDVEGLAIKPGGGFWLASEGGAGNVPPNLLLEVDAAGTLLHSIGLPDAIGARIERQGFEGVAVAGSQLYVAFQGTLNGDPPGVARIGVVDLATEAWTFFYYPLDETASGGLTGLSDIIHLGKHRFAAIERDGKGGRKSIKWITLFDTGGRAGAGPDATPPMLAKRIAVDLVPLFLDEDRKVEKEVEGLTIAADGQVYAITDNDNERPTVLVKLGQAAGIFGT